MELIGWKDPSGGYGNAGMRPEHRLGGRNITGRRKRPFWQHSGATAINPRGMGTESPLHQALFLVSQVGSGQSLKLWAFLDEPLHSKEHRLQ